MVGYVSGFFILALLTFFRTWEPKTSFGKDLIVYAFLGLWQVGYGTALFYLPLLCICTLNRLYQGEIPRLRALKELCLLMGFAFLPFLLLSLLPKLVFQGTGEMGIILKGLKIETVGWMGLLKKYFFVLFESWASLGLPVIMGTIWLFYQTIQKKTPLLLVLSAVTLAQFLGMGFLLTPLAGRGYATFNIATIPLLACAVFLDVLWRQVSLWSKGLALFFLMVILIYPLSIKLGFNYPNMVFYTGFQNLKQPWQTYEIKVLK